MRQTTREAQAQSGARGCENRVLDEPGWKDPHRAHVVPGGVPSPPIALTGGGEASIAEVARDLGILGFPVRPLAEGRRRVNTLASARAGDPQALGFRFIPDELRGGTAVLAAADLVRPRRGMKPQPPG
jgi:hypothetical protein